jgi:hypothetical protein
VRFAGALDPEIDPPPDDVADEPALEVADAFDRGAIELDHDVADAHAGAGGRPRFEQLDDLEAARPSEAIGDGLTEGTCPTDDAEERAPDATVDDQALEDPARGAVDRTARPSPIPATAVLIRSPGRASRRGRRPSCPG